MKQNAILVKWEAPPGISFSEARDGLRDWRSRTMMQSDGTRASNPHLLALCPPCAFTVHWGITALFQLLHLPQLTATGVFELENRAQCLAPPW
jgi:hypothetical protein